MLLFLSLLGCYESSLFGQKGAADDGELNVPEDTSDDTGEVEECNEVDPVVLYISPDDSNSMSSPVQARELALAGAGVGGAPIRTYEFMNYYTFGYEPAPEGELAVNVALAATDEEGVYELQIGLAAPERGNDQRDPMNLVFSVDASGSMEGPSMERVHEMGAVISASLRAGDVVSIVTWDTSQSVILDQHEVSGPGDLAVIGAFASIAAGGSTDLEAGLRTAYELATSNFAADRINRVILVSDGGANVGVTDEELIADMAGAQDEVGIYMVGVGVGEGGYYNDLLMDTVTDKGKGAALFIPSEEEALEMFGARFLETFDVAARSVQVRLDLPPGFEIRQFSGEEYSTDPEAIEPQNLAPNDAMVFYQTIEGCALDAIGEDSTITVAASWLHPVTFEPLSTEATYTFGDLLATSDPLLAKGRAVYRYAEALKFAGGSDAVSSPDPDADFEAAYTTAITLNPGDEDLAELRAVIDAL